MRILHLIQRYHPARGGAEFHLEEISARLAAANHSVTVLTSDALSFERLWNPRRERITEATDKAKGVRIIRFPLHHLPGSPLTYSAIRRLLWGLSFLPPVFTPLALRLARFTPWLPDLWRWLENTAEPFDLVACMTITYESLFEAGWHFAQRRGIPFVTYPLTHLGAGPQPGQDTLSRFYTMRHQVELVRRSDAVMAQTETEKQFYVARGMAAEKFHVAGPGVTPAEVLAGDGARFRQQHDIEGPVVLSLSSMTYDKGTVHTVEAVRQLWQAGHKLALVLAGSVTDEFKRYLATVPPIERERIHLVGMLDDDGKRDALAAATLLCMPSRTDSFGIAYLEAWLYGKPVIGAQSWGVADLISQGEDGLLVPFGDVTELARCILYLVENGAVAAAMGQAGQTKTLQHHTWEHKVNGIIQRYENLVSSAQPR
jgi:glycosyltransferase involved in cell wall biosynthesis